MLTLIFKNRIAVCFPHFFCDISRVVLNLNIQFFLKWVLTLMECRLNFFFIVVSSFMTFLFSDGFLATKKNITNLHKSMWCVHSWSCKKNWNVSVLEPICQSKNFLLQLPDYYYDPLKDIQKSINHNWFLFPSLSIHWCEDKNWTSEMNKIIFLFSFHSFQTLFLCELCVSFGNENYRFKNREIQCVA